MVIVEFIVNLIVDVIANDFGALLRFLYSRYVLRKNVKYSNFTAGTTLRAKRDKTLYNENYDKNNRWGAGFFIILAVILGISLS